VQFNVYPVGYDRSADLCFLDVHESVFLGRWFDSTAYRDSGTRKVEISSGMCNEVACCHPAPV
jgi:hypothetical protein